MTTDKTHDSSVAGRRAALVAVYVTVFLDLLGFGLILPALPFWADELGASGTTLGILFAAYSAAQLFGSIFLGRLSDRWGRRPVLLLSLAGTTLAMVGSALADSLLMLTVARLLGGLFAGSIGVGQAYISDVTTPDERPKFMGFLGAAIGGGFTFGPALGVAAVSLGWGFQGAAWIAAGLGACNFVLAIVRLRESKQRHHGPSRIGGLRVAFSQRSIRFLMLAIFLSTVAFVGMETALGLYTKDRFLRGPESFGMLLVIAGIVSMVVQGGAIGRLTKRFGVRPLAIIGSTLTGCGLAGLAIAPSFGFVILSVVVLALGQGLALPTLSTLLSFEAGDAHAGEVLGAGRSMSSAARVVGPMIAGQLYDWRGTAPFWVATVVSLIAAWMTAQSRGPNAEDS